VVADEREIGQLGIWQTARNLADERHAVVAEIEERRGEHPARHEDERAGDGGRHPSQAEDDGQRADADEHRRRVHVGERPYPRRGLAPCAVALGRRAGELRQLADDDVDGGSGEEARDHRLGEELRDPSHPQHREHQEQQSGRQRDRRNEPGRLVAGESGHRDGARPRRRRATSSVRWRCAGRCRRARR